MIINNLLKIHMNIENNCLIILVFPLTVKWVKESLLALLPCVFIRRLTYCGLLYIQRHVFYFSSVKMDRLRARYLCL